MNMEQQPDRIAASGRRSERFEQWYNDRLRGDIEEVDAMDVDSPAGDGSLPALSAMNASTPKPAAAEVDLTPRHPSDPLSHLRHRHRRPPTPPPPPTKHVSISDYSTVYYYEDCPRSDVKAYTKDDRRTFTLDAMREVLRIKRLVAAAPRASTKDSFQYLLENHVIDMEEMVGIEHLVLGKPPAELMRERQEHARAVLAEQRRQREQARRCSERTEKLGEFSATRSLKSVKKARIRAAMAA